MFKYSVLEDQIETGDTVYGVCAYEIKGNEKEKIISISDVFFNREKAENLVGLCNELDLDVIHLFDVIEDAVG